MIKIDQEMALLMHQLMAEQTGGSVGVRDEGLLDQALEACMATFDGKDLYPTKEEKAAKLGHSLISNHAFIVGNKRIGMHIMLTFLELNGIHISDNVTDAEIVSLGLGIASGEKKYEDILSWIRAHEM